MLEGRKLDVQIDAIEQRTREAPEVPLALTRAAETPVERRTAATARVRGGHELEARGKVADAPCANDGDAAVLERLAQGFEHVLLEFRKLVEEQDAEMRERDLARMRWTAAADETGDGDRVVRRAKGPARQEPTRRRKRAGHAPDRRGFDRFVCGEGREDRRETTREHRLAAAGRADEQHVVRSGRSDLERALGVGLPPNVDEVEVVVGRARRQRW